MSKSSRKRKQYQRKTQGLVHGVVSDISRAGRNLWPGGGRSKGNKIRKAERKVRGLL